VSSRLEEVAAFGWALSYACYRAVLVMACLC